MSEPPPIPSPADVDALFSSVSNWGRWGDEDQLGALNHLTPQRRAAAAGSVRDGISVSMASDFPVVPSPEQPSPAHHHMLASGDARDSNGIPGYEASRDYVSAEVHGLGITHIDALCHMFVRGEMYNGVPAAEVRSDGARRNTIMSIADGLVGRGVLLDVPRAQGREWLDAGELISVADLEATESTSGVEVQPGDILVVSTGRDRRKAAQSGRLNPFAEGLAGLHPECLPWLHEREIAALGGDGISDPMPGPGIELWPFPIHQVGIVAIGLHLIDNMALAEVSDACAERDRWEFLLMVSSLRIRGGTGCPVNPVAVL